MLPNNEDAAHALQRIRERMYNACERAGRDLSEVLLIGAAKTVEPARLGKYLQAGLEAVGENYVQEGVTKIESLGQNREQWHFIGALQRNKAREVVRHFGCVHSVDRTSLAQTLNREAQILGRSIDILLQVKVGEEDSKAGCAPHELEALFEFCRDLPHLNAIGLMCLPPPREQSELVRADFRLLCRLRDAMQARFDAASTCRHLSMGMSNDFELAIEEGATMIRVGTSLFGARFKAVARNA